MNTVVSRRSLPRVLVVHNRYTQRGGEDAVVESEVDLLRRHGHEVYLYTRHNDELQGIGRMQAARQTLWSTRTTRDFASLCDAGRFDIVHVHNTFPLVSPSLYWNAAQVGIPAVQTLHNFRLMCPQGMFLRDQRVCEDCRGRLPWRAVLHRCYRRSAAQSGVLAAMLTLHRMAGTWRHKVSRYIALNEFCRRKFVEGGLPAGKIVVKPNFVERPPDRPGAPAAHSSGLFVGRLAPEKGIDVLLAALDRSPGVTLEVAGDGPEMARVRAHASTRVLGLLDPAAVLERIRATSYLVLPSLWYENFPRTLVEAFACGRPVIASRLGALAELVVEGRTGLLFEPGNPADLARTIAWAEANPDAMRSMGMAARAEYEQKYTPERNYDLLMSIYDDALAGYRHVPS